MFARAAVCLAFVVAAVAVTPAAAQPSLPRVHLVATGGTISNRTGGRLTAEELARSMPGLERAATLTHEQFANVASSQLTLDQWLQLARRVNALLAGDMGLAGVVVTSGTDTLEETAFFLHLTIRDPRPVVVVGSMRNPSTLGYEGAANLLEGVRVAADPAARGKGVLVVLNDEINSARDVTKTDALRLQTFRSPTHGLLGVVDTDRVRFFREILQRHTADSEFDVTALATLPRVDVVMVYQGATGDVIKAMVDLGAKGLVLATAGAGATSGTQGEGLDYAAEKGVFIVTSTRTGAGRIAPLRRPAAGQGGSAQPSPAGTSTASGGSAAASASQGQGGPPPGTSPPPLTPAQQRRRDMTISAEDHTPVKSRILLMLALAKTSNRDEIQRMFSEY